MELDDQILACIAQPNYKGMDAQQLSKRLGMQDSASFTALCKELNRMEDEGILFVDHAYHYFNAEQMGYIKGKLRLNAKGFGFVETQDQSIYINKNSLQNAFPDDIVIAHVWQNPDGTKEGEVVKIIFHTLKRIVGTIKIKHHQKIFLSDRDFNQRRFNITNMDAFPLINDTKVLVVIDRYDKECSAHIEKVIGFKYDPGVDILSTLYEHDIWVDFPQNVMKEVAKIPDHVLEKDKKGRTSLLEEQIITIDGEDSRDLDDAIHVVPIEGGYRLGVHIADVSHYVKEGSEVNAEAYARGTSVYVSDRVVPMLPQVLSNGICSLNPHVERLTLTCQMDIDESGNVMRYEIFPSYIKTCERMTYTKVNEILNGNEEACRAYAHLVPMCAYMKQLSHILRKRRTQLGAIDFNTREAKIIVDEKGKPLDIKVKERGEAERIIEDFMIAANECVATHMKWMELPSMYRIHEIPEAKKMREFARISSTLGYPMKGDVSHVFPKQLQQLLKQAEKDEAYPILSTFMLRSMQKARYDNQCLGHFGLGLQEYLHFTSPIRRYPDLLVHRMLRKHLFHGLSNAEEMRKDEVWLESAAKQCSSRERIAVEAERDVEDMKKAEYMEDFIGQTFLGVISGVVKFGFFVELDNTVEGLVHVSSMHDDHYHYDERSYMLIGERTGKKYRMGQSVKVKCVGASRFKKQVDFEIIATKNLKKRQNESKPFHKKTKYKKTVKRRRI